MSLYNQLFGINQAAPILLKIIGINREDIPRFRDCFISDGCIVIHTRTGGGNRDYYDCPNEENTEGPWNSNLTSNPYYLCDEDDEFDWTYANFYFKYPEEYAEDLKAIEKQIEDYTPSEKWQSLFKELNS